MFGKCVKSQSTGLNLKWKFCFLPNLKKDVNTSCRVQSEATRIKHDISDLLHKSLEQDEIANN